MKDSSGKDKSLGKNMRLYNGYTLETKKNSKAYITLDNEKAIKMDVSTKIEIKKSGKKLEVSVLKGQVYFGTSEALDSDESLNVRTATTVTGVRGSFGWATANGDTGLVHGSVVVSSTDGRTQVPLGNGQMVRADGGFTVLSVD